MYLLTSQAWRSCASSLWSSGFLAPFPPPSQPVPPGLLGGCRCPWQPYFGSSGPCGGAFRSSRHQSTALSPTAAGGRKAARPGRAGSGSLGRNSPGRGEETDGQRFPASQTRSLSRPEKQASSVWHSRSALVWGLVLGGGVVPPQAEETPVSPGAEANSSETPGRSGRADN